MAKIKPAARGPEIPEERQDGTTVTVTNNTGANFEVNYPMHLEFPVGMSVDAPWGAVKVLVKDRHLKEVSK